jgi:primosomal protein N' (replication factor Y)
MTLRVVRVLPDVPAIDKTFDYLVPDAVRDQVRLGDVVRIELHGRRVGGWVVELDVEPPAGVTLRPLAKRSGLGPTADLIELAHWAAWRWAGRPASFLRTASPERVVTALPAPRPSRAAAPAVGPVLRAALQDGQAVVRLPPSADLAAVAGVLAARGNALVVCPSVALAASIATRLRRSGVPVAQHPAEWSAGAAGATVVGARAAVWAPVAGLAGVLVLDEHDEAHQQEQSPTWNARDVAIERARRAGVPCVLTSPCPSLEALAWGNLHVPDRARERAGWPVVEVADRREEDPRRAGLLSPALVRLLRSDQRVLCVLNRTGRSKLLACASCGELARCSHCDAAVEQPSDDLHCRRCGATRPVVCLHCGATRFKNARAGVTRVREELEALVGEPVAELTAATEADEPSTRVVVGTEAVLARIGRADAVAFLDLDQELLAPRFRAAEQAFALLARAARIVSTGTRPSGPRAGGRLLLQTRVPEHEVVQAAVHAEPERVADAERDRRELLRLPPVTAVAEMSGAAATAYVDALGRPPGVEVAEIADGRWLLRAADHDVLCNALAHVRRPPGRLRIEVDPLRA